MPWRRIVVRILLSATLLTAIGVLVIAVFGSDQVSGESWAVTAAALAVVASVILAWSNYESLEITREMQRPRPYPTVDARSRYGLLQLSVKNAGATPAHDIKLDWKDEPLRNSKGEMVMFSKHEQGPDIPVLLPNESASVLIDGVDQFFEAYEDANYSGTISFSDPAGRTHQNTFYQSVESHRKRLYYEEETSKTHYQLQKIPDILREIAKILQRFEAD